MPTLTVPDLLSLEADLRRTLSGEVRFDPYSKALYSTDASLYRIPPVGVVLPRSAGDVAAVVSLCAQAGVAVLPRGGGTSLAGQTVNHAVVMDFSKYMRGVLEVNQEQRWVRAQPGIPLDELNHHLRPTGLHYTPDPTTSSRATVGGTIGNNSCGAHSVLYGKTVDHVKEVSVVLSNGQAAHFRPLSGPELESSLAQDTLEGAIYRDALRIARDNAAEIDRRFPKIRRRVSGYNLDTVLTGPPTNLAKLIVGSEGTLAVVTEAVLNLEPLPKVRGLAILHFNSIVEAMEATIATLPHSPAAVELIDDMIIRRSRESLGFARRLTWVQGEPKAMLLVEFFADTPQELAARIDGLRADITRHGLGYACVVATSPEEQANAWAIRAAGLGLLMSVKGDAKPLPFVEDTAVDPHKLPAFVQRFDQIVRDHGTVAGYYGHASEGCLHIRPMVNIKQQDGLDKIVSIANQVSDLVLEFGGSMSGEHGDGIVRGVFTEKMFGSQLYQAFRQVKRAFDPQGIMNPGKIVDCPPMTENLRLGPSYRAWEPKTFLDFSAEGGFARAVEQCNGVGECRKTLRGAMCPSYMATLEEEHSTRGRANALRSVLSGALITPSPLAGESWGGGAHKYGEGNLGFPSGVTEPVLSLPKGVSPEDNTSPSHFRGGGQGVRSAPAAFTSQRLHDVLDLCLECKACKAECPSNVDMAKLKYEFLYHYGKANGIPLRSRLVANIAAVNAWIARLGPLARLASGSPIARLVLDRFLGLDKRRRLPAVAPQTFSQWFRKRQRNRKMQGTAGSLPGIAGGVPSQYPPPFPSGKGARGLGQVILFTDTFMEYNQPQVGVAAVELLEAAGYQVILADKVCCGRPMISKGLLEQARNNARINVQRLLPYVQRGVPVVGCEPSCLSAIRDDYPDLLRTQEARDVAKGAYLLEELLVKLKSEGKLTLTFRETKGKVLFHGHCHQKALWGTAASVAALRLIPGLEVQELDAGCCGMAGAFGYEKEHYDLSMKIGEQRLFPAVRSAPEARIAVTGFSCTHQIADGTGRRPEHVAEVLRGALAEQ
ncbi:MAG: FAD-binding protein [Chloroflexi bacterium]|nr:FAD-binding protein [Chloroflexota bacterium]